MFNEIRCDLCGSDDQKIVYSSKGTAPNGCYLITEERLSPPSMIVRCNNCGFIFAAPIDDPSVFLDAYVKMVDKKYIEEEPGRRLSGRSILKKLGRFKKDGNRLLDIGCCAGFLLDEARAMGWDAYGVELSVWASRYAHEKFNLKVYNAELEKACFPDEYFDAVVMQDTIEHLQRPREALLEVNRILKASGVLYINTPDIESLVSRALKAKWWGINQFHLHYFSKKSLNKLLNRSGFAAVRYGSYARTFTLNYWAERFRNYNALIYRILRFIAKTGAFKNSFITIDLGDQIEVFARKI